MTTLSTSSINWLANEWEKTYKTAVLSGVVGDLAHKLRGGYHISREDQPKTNYSVIRPDDKPGNGPNDRAAAIDMTMSTADIIKCHTQLRTLWKNRDNDPRFKYINAWNGWDGQGDAGRYDVVKGTISFASSDHKWHIHLEIRRKYVNDMNAMKAILSLLKGESIATYLGTPAKPNTSSGDDEVTPADIQAIADAVWEKAYGTNSTKSRFGKDSDKASTYLMLNAIYGYDSVKNLSALASVVAGIAEKVDLDPAEIEALKNALAVPTAQENADAVVAGLSNLSAADLANTLRSVLGAGEIAALKAAL
jgi:hypothetical protein